MGSGGVGAFGGTPALPGAGAGPPSPPQPPQPQLVAQPQLGWQQLWQQELQQQFQAKLLPILVDLSKEKGLQVLFSAGDSGVIWAEPGIDLTLEAVKRLDAAKK